MNKYVFNFKAIALEPRLRVYNNTAVWVVDAKNLEEAANAAAEHFKTNRQFRFEYEYAGMEGGLQQ